MKQIKNSLKILICCGVLTLLNIISGFINVSAVEVDQVCNDFPIISSPTIFTNSNGSPKETYYVYLSIDDSMIDEKTAYLSQSLVRTYTCPFCNYPNKLGSNLIPLTKQDDIDILRLSSALNNKDLSGYNYKVAISSSSDFEVTVGGVGLMYYEYILKSADNVFLKTKSGNKCIGSFEVAQEPPDIENRSCAFSTVDESNMPDPQDSTSTGYYGCIWLPGPGEWSLNPDDMCNDGYIPNVYCDKSNKDPFYFDKTLGLQDSSHSGFCSVCEKERTLPSGTNLKGYNEECSMKTDKTLDDCEKGFICQKSNVDGKDKCLKIIAQNLQECTVGENECGTSSYGDRLLSCISTSEIKYSNGRIGSKGICLAVDSPDLEKIECIDSDTCIEKLNEKHIFYPSGSSFETAEISMRDYGYVDAICDPAFGTCVFAASGEEAEAIKKQKEEDLGVDKPKPVIPAPPSRVIEKCVGNDNCARCVARLDSDSSVARDQYFEDAASLEFDYNTEIDTWKKEVTKGDRSPSPVPTPQGFQYTGYIYTSLGCIDTTDNGLITRVVQIALGIIGGVILLRFAQAAIKLQGGGTPEDRAEAVEIVSSAVVALLLFVMSLIGLRYLGVNVFQVFSPGTIEIEEP